MKELMTHKDIYEKVLVSYLEYFIKNIKGVAHPKI